MDVTQLSGRRRIVQEWVQRAVAGLSLVALVGCLLPSHHVWGAAAHSHFTDLGFAVLIPLAAMVLIAAWGVMPPAFRRKGYIIGGAAMLAPTLVVVAAVRALPHLLEKVESGAADFVFAIGIFGLFAAGVAAVVCELVLYRLERRQPTRSLGG